MLCAKSIEADLPPSLGETSWAAEFSTDEKMEMILQHSGKELFWI
jgi:hypothetical protein